MGYHDLPQFPEVAPESNRGPSVPPDWSERSKEVKRRGEAFYNSDSSPADGNDHEGNRCNNLVE